MFNVTQEIQADENDINKPIDIDGIPIYEIKEEEFEEYKKKRKYINSQNNKSKVAKLSNLLNSEHTYNCCNNYLTSWGNKPVTAHRANQAKDGYLEHVLELTPLSAVNPIRDGINIFSDLNNAFAGSKKNILLFSFDSSVAGATNKGEGKDIRVVNNKKTGKSQQILTIPKDAVEGTVVVRGVSAHKIATSIKEMYENNNGKIMQQNNTMSTPTVSSSPISSITNFENPSSIFSFTKLNDDKEFVDGKLKVDENSLVESVNRDPDVQKEYDESKATKLEEINKQDEQKQCKELEKKVQHYVARKSTQKGGMPPRRQPIPNDSPLNKANRQQQKLTLTPTPRNETELEQPSLNFSFNITK